MSAPTASIEVALAHASRLMATDPALAGEQASEILRIVDRHPMALLLLAVSHSARGEHRQAIDVLQPLADAQPNWAIAHQELGVALGRAGRGEQAVAALRRAVALKPDLPQAWRALADHLAATGDDDGAAVAYTRHVRHSTRDPELMRAAAALAENRIAEVETLLRAHLRKSPTDVAAIRMLAEVAARLGRLEDAQPLLERCLELAPDFTPRARTTRRSCIAATNRSARRSRSRPCCGSQPARHAGAVRLRLPDQLTSSAGRLRGWTTG